MFAARATATADRLVRHFGEGATAALRTRHTLVSTLTGSILDSLEVDGAHVLGAMTLSLRATSVQGILVKGIEFQIAGDPTVYMALQNTEAVNDKLASVPIDPDLQQAAADGAVVTITSAFVDVTRPCAVTKFRDDQIDNEHVLAEDRMVVISLAPGPVDPEISGDVVINGRRHPVKAVLPLQPGDSMAALRLHVGTAR